MPLSDAGEAPTVSRKSGTARYRPREQNAEQLAQVSPL
jgi:hypothetical protein